MRGLGYQIVTVPTEHYNEDALHRSIGALCDVTRYSMPQLRVGTLNVLISLSDELAKLNAASGSKRIGHREEVAAGLRSLEHPPILPVDQHHPRALFKQE